MSKPLWEDWERLCIEVERLKAELQEAREIIQQQLGFPFGSAERARAFLDKEDRKAIKARFDGSPVYNDKERG